jgi:hypothetical protein
MCVCERERGSERQKLVIFWIEREREQAKETQTSLPSYCKGREGRGGGRGEGGGVSGIIRGNRRPDNRQRQDQNTRQTPKTRHETGQATTQIRRDAGRDTTHYTIIGTDDDVHLLQDDLSILARRCACFRELLLTLPNLLLLCHERLVPMVQCQDSAHLLAARKRRRRCLLAAVVDPLLWLLRLRWWWLAYYLVHGAPLETFLPEGTVFLLGHRQFVADGRGFLFRLVG